MNMLSERPRWWPLSHRVATVSSPSNFVALKSVNYNPPNPANVQCATRVTLSPASAVPLANNVAAVKFDFTSPSPENGFCGYAEIALFGQPTGISPVTVENLRCEHLTDPLGIDSLKPRLSWQLNTPQR